MWQTRQTGMDVLMGEQQEEVKINKGQIKRRRLVLATLNPNLD